MRVRPIALLLITIPLLSVSASPLVRSLSYHKGFVAVEVEENGLRWINLYTEDLQKIWSSSKARYSEYNWSSLGSIAVRLCDGPCYNVNWQRIQVYDPKTGSLWNSSKARFVRGWWSPKGELALVLWLSPCPDYSKHWMEAYDPATGRSWRTDYRGFVYARWSPEANEKGKGGEEIAAVVRDERGYHLEILDDELREIWESQPAQVVDFKWSRDGKLAVRLELNGTEVLLLRHEGKVEKLAEGRDIKYAWSETGDLAYSMGNEVKVVRFNPSFSSNYSLNLLFPWSVPIVLVLLTILILLVIWMEYHKGKEGELEGQR